MATRITDKDCEEWRKSPRINPKTGKKLYYGKKPYNEYLNRCGSPQQDQKKEKATASPRAKTPSVKKRKEQRPSTKKKAPSPPKKTPTENKKKVIKTPHSNNDKEICRKWIQDGMPAVTP